MNVERTDSVPPLAPGSLVAAGYEVIEHLSRGRRLDVYDAWSEERRARCIAKVLRPERREDAKARRKLLREGHLLQSLTHPNIVRGYETLMEDPSVVVMETLGGETLAHMIHGHDTELSSQELGQLGLQLGSAVAYLHGHGILHLDLKPDNVVAECGRAKLIDLSLAREPGPAPAGIGTWCYLAPEQARGGDLGPPADVWGIGVTLFEAATKVPAYDDDEISSASSPPTSSEAGELATWQSGEPDHVSADDYPQLSKAPPPVASLRTLPDGLAGAIDRCLESTPAERPSLVELLAAFELAAEVPADERRFVGMSPSDLREL